MNKILPLIALFSILLSCSSNGDIEDNKCIDIIASISYQDESIESPEGYILLFDATLDDIESYYLINTGYGDDKIFAISDNDGDYIFPKYREELSQLDSTSLGFISPSDIYEDYPKEMLLYLYINVPSANIEYRNMYSFKELTIGAQMYSLDKSFPLIDYVKSEGSIIDSKLEYVEW